MESDVRSLTDLTLVIKDRLLNDPNSSDLDSNSDSDSDSDGGLILTPFPPAPE
jgi:hypothetical protein